MATYIGEFPIRRRLKAKGLHPDSDATEHDSILWDMQNAHAAVKKLR